MLHRLHQAKGQISLEYLIISGFIFGAVIIPSILFFMSFAGSGVQDTISQKQIRDLGNGIVSGSQQIYYLGLYSKLQTEYAIPEGIERILVVHMTDSIQDWYYLVFHTNQKGVAQKYYFESEIPLASQVNSFTDYFTDPNIPLNPTGVTECDNNVAYPTIECDYYEFKEPLINPGRKQFKLETKPENDVAKVFIYPLIT